MAEKARIGSPSLHQPASKLSPKWRPQEVVDTPPHDQCEEEEDKGESVADTEQPSSDVD